MVIGAYCIKVILLGFVSIRFLCIFIRFMRVGVVVLCMITPDQETDGGYEHSGDDRYFKVGSLFLLFSVIGDG